MTRTVGHALHIRVTDAELGAFAQAALSLPSGDAAPSPVRHGESRTSCDGDEKSSYRLGDDRVGVDVREEHYTIDAGGINDRPNGGLLAFAAYGLPAGLQMDVRRESDGSDVERVLVTFTGPNGAADAFEEAFCELVRLSRAEVTALEALRRVSSFPETMGFELPSRALGWELAPAQVFPARIAAIVARWNDAHVAHDAVALGSLYADHLYFYGMTLSRSLAVARQQTAFAQSPAYTQSVRDLVTKKRGERWVVRFTKTSNGKDYPSVLYIDPSGLVSAEMDALGPDWCHVNDKLVVPPFTISQSQAAAHTFHAHTLAGRTIREGPDSVLDYQRLQCPDPTECDPSTPRTGPPGDNDPAARCYFFVRMAGPWWKRRDEYGR